MKKPKITSIYLKIGIVVVVSGAILLLIAAMLFRDKGLSNVTSVLSTIIDVLTPFIIGAFAAYLVSPIFNKLTEFFYQSFKEKNKARAFHLAKGLSLLITMIFLLAILTGIIWIIVPSIITTLSDLIAKVPGQIEGIKLLVTDLFNSNPIIADAINSSIGDIQKNIIEFGKNTVLPGATDVVTVAATSAYSIVMAIVDFVIGIIVCIYLLLGKERFLAQSKKIMYALFEEQSCERMFKLARKSDRIFGGFLTGKIIDSLIMGIICAVGMGIMCGLGILSSIDASYIALISTIVGITNIIPFFGPVIGAIPTTLLILVQSPMDALWFLIFFIVIMQLDGNLIGPKILGDSTGISSFWVLFSIIVFGGFFGFMGMVLGVPIFALIYTYFADFISKKLNEKGKDVDTDSYENYNIYGIKDKTEIGKG